MIATLTEWGQFLGGLAAILTAIAGAIVWTFNRWRKHDLKQITDHFDTKVWAIVEKRMLEAAARAGPDQTHVIRVIFVNGSRCSMPLTHEWVEVDPCGAKIQLFESTDGETSYQLHCPAPYQTATHAHIEEESITVQRGSMTDVLTGDVFSPGDTWIIPPQTPHTVLFSAGSLMMVTVRPPLPRNTSVPLDLKNLKQSEYHQFHS
jgi:hypothetical protein